MEALRLRGPPKPPRPPEVSDTVRRLRSVATLRQQNVVDEVRRRDQGSAVLGITRIAEAASLRHRCDSSPSDERQVVSGSSWADSDHAVPRRGMGEEGTDVVASTASARRPATRDAVLVITREVDASRRHAALDRYVESNMTDSKELVELAKEVAPR